MRKYGKTAAGKQRWQCSRCELTAARQDPAAQHRQCHKVFIRWVVSMRPQEDIAKELGLSVRHLRRKFDLFLRDIPAAPSPTWTADCLLLDGLHFRKTAKVQNDAVLIAVADRKVYSFDFAASETFETWRAFLARLPKPRLVVIDENTALARAVREVWGDVPRQRCLVHVSRETRNRLLSCGGGELARDLNGFRKALAKVKDEKSARLWRRKFDRWSRRHHDLLEQRERDVDRLGRYYCRRYTHAKLRAAYSHLRNASENAFVYLSHENGERTTNYLEGGINSRIAEFLLRHRGMPRDRQKALVAHFLLSQSA